MRIEAGLGSTIARDASLTCLSDGVDRFRLFNVLAGGGLTLVGVTLENGCAPRGGAALVKGAGVYLDAVDSTFRANAAQGVNGVQLTAEGRAVRIGTDSELTLDGCLFDSNGAHGFFAGGGFGGAISARSGANPISIIGSDFVGNEAAGGDNPLIGGAAVDRGSCSASGATTDARGFTRPFDVTGSANADDGCDAGAYEVQDANGNGIDDAFEIFADGFESGDTATWTTTVP